MTLLGHDEERDLERKIEEDDRLARANLYVAKQRFCHLAATDTNCEYYHLWKASLKTDLARMGVGVQLYFTFVWQLAAIFFVVAILAIPQIVICSKGNMLATLSTSSLENTMLANLGIQPDIPFGVSKVEAMRLFMSRLVVIGTSVLSIRGCTFAFGLLDAFGVILILGWLFWFYKIHTPHVVHANDSQTWTMGDHAIVVEGLPKRLLYQNDYRAALRDHFRRILYQNRHRPILPDNGLEITEVCLVRDFNGDIDELLGIGQLQHELDSNAARRYWGHHVPYSSDDRLIQKMQKKLNNVLVNKYIPVKERDVVMAFICFNWECDKQYVCEQYTHNKHRLLRHRQAKNLQFEGHKIVVQQAPEPEDLIWENLDVPRMKRYYSTALVYLVAFIILAVSFIFEWMFLKASEIPKITAGKKTGVMQILASQRHDTWMLRDVKAYSDEGCSKEIPVSKIEPFYDRMRHLETMQQDKDIWVGIRDPNVWNKLDVGVNLHFDEPLEASCVGIEQHGEANHHVKTIAVRLCDVLNQNYAGDRDSEQIVCTEAGTLAFGSSWAENKFKTFPLTSWIHMETSSCQRTDADELSLLEFQSLLSADPSVISEATQHWYTSCYCFNKFFEVIYNNTIRHHCSEYIMDLSRRMLLAGFSSLLIHVFNFILKRVIRFLVRFEKHKSKSAAMKSGLVKVFLAQYINSAVILMIVDAQLLNDDLMVYSVNLSGGYAELSPMWYIAVGKRFLMISITYIFLPHTVALLKMPLRYLLRRHRSKNKVIQEDLNKLWTPKEFKIDTKYAAVLSFTFLVWTYSAPLPCMAFFCSMALVVIYWCDKIELLWGAARPPFYDRQMSDTAMGLIPFGVLLHCIVAVAAYGYPLVSPSWTIYNYNAAKMMSEMADTPTYYFDSPYGFFSSTFWSKVPLYLSSASSLVQLIIAGLISIGFIVMLIIYSILLCGFNLGHEYLIPLLRFLDTSAEDHVDAHSIAYTKSHLQSQRCMTSYFIRHNPKYSMVHRGIKWLESQPEKREEKGFLKALFDKTLGNFVGGYQEVPEEENSSDDEYDKQERHEA